VPAATAHRYLLALGSNQRHARFGNPRRVLDAALERLRAEGVRIAAVAPVFETDPIGPSIRRYANSAALIDTDLEPASLLALIKRIEREFGRRASGQRWRARVLDLDIVLWSGGAYGSPGLTIPHKLFRERDFVLEPVTAIASDWKDPLTSRTVRQLRAQLTGPRPLPKRAAGKGP
jgi:2-amino-4-hydroxy-6-hydroxymethyldihydropteridine diphosphokinase